ncbi:MAG: hypothetical protein R2774_10315 [Saprospiraceae bacterium]
MTYINIRFHLLGFVLLSILLFQSCKNEVDCCVIVDVDVQVHYKNGLGQNLINSSAEFQASNIKIFYKKGDTFEYVYNSNLDSPNMHRIDTDSDNNIILTVFPSNYYEGNFSTTLIRLNETVVDTLVCEFLIGNGKEICKKAWLNGVEMENRFIEVVK